MKLHLRDKLMMGKTHGPTPPARVQPVPTEQFLRERPEELHCGADLDLPNPVVCF
jgi:hypothetical protein